ncbi:MAG: exo-alpha-sialidase [Planctomycetes bacterium]|nr:exo-alpha-sialidase [Planctomycetota bacterium]
MIHIGVGVSLDGGATWSDSILRPEVMWQGNLEFDPMTAYDDRTGTLWAGGMSRLAQDGAIFVARKDPGQSTFGPAITAWTGPRELIDKGWMAAGPPPGNPNATNVYIAFVQGFLVSTDMGNEWTLTTFWQFSGDHHLPRVGPGGEVYVVYREGGPVPLRHFLFRSFDGGSSFGTPILIVLRNDTWSDPTGSRFPGRFRAFITHGFAVDKATGILYFVYFDKTNVVNGNVNIDLYLTKSFDQGANWTTPVIINGDPDPPGDQFFPWLEVDQRGNLHLVFLDSSNTVQDDNVEHGMLDAYYAFSDDGGDTWQEFRLTPNSFDSFDDGLNRSVQFLGDYLGLARGDCRVYPSYLSTQNGDPDIFSHVIEVEAACCIERRPGFPICLNLTQS